MSETLVPRPSLQPFLQYGLHDQPFLAGSRCRQCGHVFVGERSVCAQCLARNDMESVRLAETGKLYVYTIIHRSFPGVKTPFIDVIVDLDDGAHLKGTLRGVTADPAALAFGLPVRVVYEEAVPFDKPGQPHLSFYFEPINATSAEQA